MRWFFVILFFLSGYAFASNDQSKVRLIQLVEAYIQLEEKRIGILQKQKLATNESQRKSAAYTKKKTELDKEEHLQRIAKLQKLLNLVRTSNDTKLIKKNIETTLDCDLENCLSILGSQNSQLATQVSAITSHIMIKSWNQFAIQKSSDEVAGNDKSFNASVDLAVRTWTCNRGIGNWEGTILMDHEKMSSCMYNTFKKKFPKAKIDLSGSKEFAAHRTADAFVDLGSKSPRILETLSGRVLKAKDYQLRPWELFESCTEVSDGDLRKAIDLCYQVLRYNRQRPIFTRKLMDIRGDRSAGGDNSGDWYHFFGMMYKGMTMGSFTPIAYNIYSLLPMVDEVEERSDRAGMNVGLEMRKFVKDNQPARVNDLSSQCNVKRIFNFEN